ncbi:MAG TPA: aminotransferase class III-fold pyridoxal phosphate-dependent enzyme [Dehalococcoidia bacterium]|nr:aminotransferase class III-fold pyridoxal phosphate-dependent enzyme [Dehalococcoidia bacterium]
MASANIAEQYKQARPGSLKLHERAERLFPADGATHGARVLDPFRPYITHAKGSKKWDVDGNEYIDYGMGHGALILGHGHPAIVQAIQEQTAKGLHYSENQPLEVEWGELISQMMPVAERIEVCASGQEGNLMAIRIARTFTGRKKIIRFEENFHGWAGEVAPEGSAGVTMPEVTFLPMNDIAVVEKELASREYALVMIEGGGAHMAGQIPWEYDFIRELPLVTKKYGTLLLIDEVVTGFRESRGGWQELVGVKPDLTTLGKCVGGGIPVGAVVGRADVMEVLDPKRPAEKRIRHTGTWNANPIQCAAGIAACKLYLNGEPQKKAAEIGAYLREQGNKMLKEKKISGRLYGRTIIHLYLGPIEYEPSDPAFPPTRSLAQIINPAMIPIKNELCLRLLERGIATMGARFFVMSAAHTREDVDRTVAALASSLDEMMATGALKESLAGVK